MFGWFRQIQIMVVVVLVLLVGIQSIRAKHLGDLNKELRIQIIKIKAGQALTDQLRKANAILNKDQQGIEDDLRDAKGYSDPLPPDVIGILERLR